jgi:4a-hydroxytetrahydrobiopterin dehydratase
MTDLVNRHCTTPAKGETPLNDEQARAFLAKLNNEWMISQDGKSISHDFGFSNFHETMSFVNAIAWIAHKEDHHPDLAVGYKHCLVNYSTHAVGGLSINDFICAAKIDAL